jgi:DNA modification methylase
MELDYKILEGNCLTKLKELPDNSIQMCVTSPPYFNLRDYGTGHWEGGDPNCEHKGKLIVSNHNFNYADGRGSNGEIRSNVCEKCGAIKVDEQIGLEETPEQFVDNLVQVFHEVKRVLKEDGTLWINIGDSYCNSNGFERSDTEWKRKGRADAKANDRNLASLHNVGLKTKDLIGIPWMLAFALRADGWYLRQDIIWHKTNPMPESVKDRCTKSHEYIFLLSKSPNYYFNFDAIQEDATEEVSVGIKFGGNKYGNGGEQFPNKQAGIYSGNEYVSNGRKRKRDVWSVPVSSSKDNHFATYPKKLIEPCILAGSREGDTVLDPFNGSGTTGIVAMQWGRKYIGCELNPEYIAITESRFEKELQGAVYINNNGTTVIAKREGLWDD